MTLEEAKQILRDNGISTCLCKYNGDGGVLIEEAIKIVKEKEKKIKS